MERLEGRRGRERLGKGERWGGGGVERDSVMGNDGREIGGGGEEERERERASVGRGGGGDLLYIERASGCGAMEMETCPKSMKLINSLPRFHGNHLSAIMTEPAYR